MRLRLACAVAATLVGCGFRLSGAPADPDGRPDAVGSEHDAPIDSTVSCPDADHDTICDAVDVCPGFDDRLDRDGDGVPDGCDDWQCGATAPAAPGDPMTFHVYGHNQIIGMADIDGQGRVAQVTQAAAVNVTVGWVVDIDCSGSKLLFSSCRTQLELGFDPAGRFGCALDKSLTSNQIDVGVNTIAAPVPAPGLYSLRVNAARNPQGCGTTTTWTGMTPPAAQTVAYLCVY